MANGDSAAAAGLPVVPPTKDFRLGYDDINRLADSLAAHLVSGGHAWDKISNKPATYPGTWDTTAGKPVGGVVVSNTNANASVIFTHGLGRTPGWVNVTLGGTPMGTLTEQVALYGDLILWRITPTEIEVRLKRTDTSSWFPSQGIAFSWVAG